MKSKLLSFYLTLLLSLFSFVAFAQVNPPADDDPPPAPINTKLIWLGVFGITFAFYYFKKKKYTYK